jgi:hypothetical protein
MQQKNLPLWQPGNGNDGNNANTWSLFEPAVLLMITAENFLDSNGRKSVISGRSVVKNKFPQVWQAENTGGWDISYTS